ncbi:MAG: MBL fold metallo-hydrolase [Myxococcota bacterium]|jgi:alkyl sulfatase BDS1-like metallo-beta-lactamase superfamily hydrolase|nr:MBL fold metallo-hydrolase [Myxococcota bacterium]
MSQPIYRTRPGGFDIQPACQEEAEEILEGIYLSRGLSNSFLIVTGEGRVVINTGMGFEAPVHKRNYDAVDESPIRYIVLTQGHVDHVGGVDYMAESGTELVAQANNAACQADDARLNQFRPARSGFAFAETIGKALRYVQAQGGAISAQSRPEPTLTFEDEYAFELGGQRFELFAVPGGETVDSLAIWMPERGACFSGNLFSALFGHIPNLVTIRGDRYREALGFVDSLEKVLALDAEVLLVGHHDPLVGHALIRSELERLRDATLYIHDETIKGMNAGKDVHTLMREIKLPREFEVGEGYGKVAWDIRAIWENYAGFFHHRSTTELYGVPVESIFGDLGELAGGAEAVANRAAERLAAGETLEAVHLVEVALGADPQNTTALEVAVAAHRQLDSESENFWLSSWLRKQIAEFEVRRASGGDSGR